MLAEGALSNHGTTGNALYGCMLGAINIVKTSIKITYLHFTNRVVKTQNNDMESVSSYERIFL